MNMYWLGLDENCEPGQTQGGCIAYPTHFRIADAITTAAALGANVIRAHTVGISTGNNLSLQPNASAFNDQAFDTIDFAIAQVKKRIPTVIMIQSSV